MKHSNTTKLFALAAISALALSIAPAAKAADKGCTNFSLTGTFAYTATGSSVAPLPPGAVRRSRYANLRRERRHHRQRNVKHQRSRNAIDRHGRIHREL